VLGTHAILQDDVQFAKLGLVVIDEQHKFGVRQRARLRSSGRSPHYLVMTATPIPRTLTLTVFGDLEVSVLREMPPGRKEVNTYLVKPDARGRWWEFVRSQLRGGRQAYVIAPLVDASSHYQVASAEETFESLVNGELEAFRVALVHGRMTPREKQSAMEDFRAGRAQVLVATSVVEVGVDVPNATVMTIQSPERFGLAQLHQLRGRICRGNAPGFCGALVDSRDRALDEHQEAEAAPAAEAEGSLDPQEASERLEAFARTTDGFELAEVDFRLRGPGDIFGVKQHGLPPLLIANLVRDAHLVEEARREAQSLVAADPGLARDDHALLRRMMLTRYGGVLELGDVG
jgi:ATP-dependent DNA helicase RecG